MSHRHVEVRHGQYHDSVTLLGVSRTVAQVHGVAAAQVAMATPLNLDVLAQMEFELPATSPDDLVVALRLHEGVDAEPTVAAALDAVRQALSPRRATGGAAAQVAPATTGSALRAEPTPLVLVSVPGASAAAEAWDALDAGSHVMLFSDNVDLDDEVALKEAAAERGLLVMGPDCGTAVVGGVGLGFANVVRPGPVSLVAASGTGAQHLMSLLDAQGIGVRHCLGVGGRDLGARVGGLAAERALRLLSDDDGTELVVLVSKPADAGVVRRLEEVAVDVGLDLVWAVLGADSPGLTAAAEQVCARLGVENPRWPVWGAQAHVPDTGTDRPRHPDNALLRGLFAGGTLCDETMVLASRTVGAIASNVPLDGAPAIDASGPGALAAALRTAGHAVVDLGDDTLTLGRAHPMIDPTLRLDAIAAAADDPRVRVVLLDVVLGHGAHADPASAHAPAIAQALATAHSLRHDLDVVVTLVGTADDPQGRDAQAEALAASGAHVHLSNAEATAAAVALLPHADSGDAG